MRKNYPEDYFGPKAGEANDDEWLGVTEYAAFKLMLAGTWSYSDFDCWLATRDKNHYVKGEEALRNALKEEIEKFLVKLNNT